MTDDALEQRKAAAKLAASEYATHKPDCTCKGQYFSKEKHDSFLSGVAYESPLAERRGYLRGLEEAAKVAQDCPGYRSVTRHHADIIAREIRALSERGEK